MSFVIKDVNCNFLLQGGLGSVGGIVGSSRTYNSATGLTLLTRGRPYFKKAAIRGAPIPGIVVGYYSTAVPRMTTQHDYARYESAERGSFEAFNYIYKVWMPCIKAELSVEDFEDKNKKQFLKKVASMADVTVSLGANEVQGAIPPGTLVDVKFGRKYALKNPQIVNIKEKIFDISTAFPDPPGRPFVLGSAGTMAVPPGGDPNGYNSGPPPAAVAPAEVLEKAKCYDTQQIPGKAANEAKLMSLHQDFIPYVKLFICECASRGIEIKLTSGYRSPAKQREIYNKWVSRGKTGPKPAPPGRSYHNVGMAFDYNAILPNGNRLYSASSKKKWNDSGIVAIGESIGLYWGGHFSTNYDPIHWDFRNIVPKQQKTKFYQAAVAAGNEPNRHPRTA
tara:strand:+ start:260 stop:1435 length:1176 start_codon:yes stop_codon:yes gene_type:complete